MIPDVPREKLLEAMARFDDEMQDTNNWQQNSNHRYAIEHEGRLYPVKQIIALATEVNSDTFRGGDEANTYLIQKGFTVVPLDEQNEHQRTLKAAFVQFQQDRADRFFVQLRRKRAEQLRQLLSQPDNITPDMFNREVWVLESETLLRGNHIRLMGTNELTISEEMVAELEQALESGELELHGNYVWGSGSRVYGPRFPAAGEKTERIRQALQILNDPELTPLEKARQIMDVPGFGENISTGLVMLFHPTKFALSNNQSKEALKKLGYAADPLETFQQSAEQLRQVLGAEDFVELDLFLYRINERKYDLATRAQFWWVNQGETYQTEKAGGYLWAPKKSKSGVAFSHHTNLTRLQTGDVVFHYANGVLRAVSQVCEPAIDNPRPSELPTESWDLDGYLVRVNYHELSTSIALQDIPIEWRTPGEGPFTKQSGVKQGYVFPLPYKFVQHFVQQFKDSLPTFLVSVVQDGNSKLPHRMVKIAPGEGARFWDDCLAGGYICVGWDNVGDLRMYSSKEAFKARFREIYGAGYNHNEPHISRKANELWTLCELKPGDVVVANRGSAEVLGVGEVLAPGYQWCPEREEYKHTVAVHWDTSFAKRIPEQKAWTTATVLDVSPDLYDLIHQQDESNKPYIEPDFDHISRSVRASGMRISERDVRRYHLALKTRGFVILSGLSGTGKTWLSEVYAKAVNAQYRLVAVAPNWTTNEDLLGYYNPMDNVYHDTPFSQFLRDAAEEYRRAQAVGQTPQPYHLVLDEMNLARVEYYFAKFLSAIEVRMRDRTATINLGPRQDVVLPPNLQFIGTVNIDETTHGFADKVYDRAQLIELELSRAALHEHLADAPYGAIVMEIWDAIHPVAPFAFRVLDEMKQYIREAEALGIAWESALDEQLLHKILPKLKGADLRVGEALQQFVDIIGPGFPLSNAKASAMREGYLQHGFASFF
jgi:hypothetical protein